MWLSTVRVPEASIQSQTSASRVSRVRTVRGLAARRTSRSNSVGVRWTSVAVPAHPSLGPVDLDVADLQRRDVTRDAGVGELAGALDPADQGVDPGDQLAHGERLGHVVVGADAQPDQHVGLVVAGGEHQHRHRAARPGPGGRPRGRRSPAASRPARSPPGAVARPRRPRSARRRPSRPGIPPPAVAWRPRGRWSARPRRAGGADRGLRGYSCAKCTRRAVRVTRSVTCAGPVDAPGRSTGRTRSGRSRTILMSTRPGGQAQLAHQGLGDVGGDAGGLLGPAQPQPAGLGDPGGQVVQVVVQRGQIRAERQDDVVRRRARPRVVDCALCARGPAGAGPSRPGPPPTSTRAPGLIPSLRCSGVPE